MGIFSKRKADMDTVQEVAQHVKGTMQMYMGTFGGHYTPNDKKAQALKIVHSLQGYTPRTHKPITASDMKLIEKLIKESC